MACEEAWLYKLLGDFGLQVNRKVVIYCDNLSSTQKPMFHAKTKDIEIHYHYIQEKFISNDTSL